MARIILVHGAFSGAWAWEPVIPALEAAGHSVTAIDLPGSGEDQTPADEVTLDGYAKRVSEALEAGDEACGARRPQHGRRRDHARGRLAPDRIRKLVYVCAFLPPDGKGLLDMTQPPEGADDQIQANLIIEPPPVGRLTDEGVRKAAYNNTPEDAILAALPRRRPQPLAPMGMPVSRGPGFDSIPRAYVVCTRDQSIPPPLQRRMIADDGHVSEVFELDTDHVPTLSATDELVGILDRAASAA